MSQTTKTGIQTPDLCNEGSPDAPQCCICGEDAVSCQECMCCPFHHCSEHGCGQENHAGLAPEYRPTGYTTMVQMVEDRLHWLSNTTPVQLLRTMQVAHAAWRDNETHNWQRLLDVLEYMDTCASPAACLGIVDQFGVAAFVEFAAAEAAACQEWEAEQLRLVENDGPSPGFLETMWAQG